MRITIVFVLLVALTTPASGQIFSLPNPNPQEGDQFGIAASISQDRVLIGASDSNSCGESSGAAYIYSRDDASGKWTLETMLQPGDCAEGIYFGKVVALDGDLAAVASYKPAFSNILPNAVYVFERDSLGWHQAAKLVSPDSDTGPFASSIAIEENQIIVSSAGDIPENRFHGAVYVFTKTGGRWSLDQSLRTTAHVVKGIFGSAISIDKDLLTVSASRYFDERNGSLHMYERDSSGRFSLAQVVNGIDDFQLPTMVHEGKVIAGARRARRDKSGLALVYARDSSGVFVEEEALRPLHPFEDGAFGSDVALDTDLALVVGYDEQLKFEFNIDRVVYVFERGTDALWRQKHVIDVGSVFFGSSIDIEDRVAVIGEASEREAGKAYIIHIN